MQLQTWGFSHVKRDANSTVNQLARSAATELISGDNPCNVEYFFDLSWLYEGTDPRNLVFWFCLILIKLEF